MQSTLSSNKMAWPLYHGIGNISTALANALPAVQKIQGVWQGMSDDIAAIVTMIDKDIRQVPPVIMNLGVSEAVTA